MPHPQVTDLHNGTKMSSSERCWGVQEDAVGERRSHSQTLLGQVPALRLSFLVCEMGGCGHSMRSYRHPWCVTSTKATLAFWYLDVAGAPQSSPLERERLGQPPPLETLTKGQGWDEKPNGFRLKPDLGPSTTNA